MNRISRRHFLTRSAAVATASFALPYIVPSSAIGAAGSTAPGNRITMGAIGAGGMGTYDLKNFLEQDDVRLLGVCDVETKHRQHLPAVGPQMEMGSEDRAVHQRPGG